MAPLRADEKHYFIAGLYSTSSLSIQKSQRDLAINNRKGLLAQNFTTLAALEDLLEILSLLF